MILVLGTGRSGTSAVAQFLHESGINMGKAFHLPDEFNTNGYWEDKEFQDLNCKYAIMGLGEHNIQEPKDLWENMYYKLINERTEPYGIKEPSMLDHEGLLNYYLALKPDIIWCDRDKEDTINSLMRFQGGMSYIKAEELYEKRLKQIKRVYRWWRDLKVDCYDTNKFKKIRTWLKRKNYLK